MVRLLTIFVQSLWLRKFIDMEGVQALVPPCFSPFSRHTLELALFEGTKISAINTSNQKKVS